MVFFWTQGGMQWTQVPSDDKPWETSYTGVHNKEAPLSIFHSQRSFRIPHLSSAQAFPMLSLTDKVATEANPYQNSCCIKQPTKKGSLPLQSHYPECLLPSMWDFLSFYGRREYTQHHPAISKQMPPLARISTVLMVSFWVTNTARMVLGRWSAKTGFVFLFKKIREGRVAHMGITAL